MSRRVEIYVFAGLLAVLGVVLYNALRPGAAEITGVYAADVKFQPLDVQEPQLHLDLLDNLRKIQYAGSHRDIFVAAPIPPPKPVSEGPKTAAFVGPRVPPPPPPLQVPVQFFGYASEPKSGRRLAFFASGDDVLVLAEGDEFLDRFRLLRIGNDSAEVMEISSGRHATIPIVQPPGEAANQ
jgi:hypothetical protein